MSDILNSLPMLFLKNNDASFMRKWCTIFMKWKMNFPNLIYGIIQSVTVDCKAIYNRYQVHMCSGYVAELFGLFLCVSPWANFVCIAYSFVRKIGIWWSNVKSVFAILGHFLFCIQFRNILWLTKHPVENFHWNWLNWIKFWLYGYPHYFEFSSYYI